MESEDLETKLLSILSEDTTRQAAGNWTPEEAVTQAEAAVAAAFPEMTEKAKRTMARVMTAEMPSPEEIAQAERVAQHNAEIDRKRAEKLRRRAERRHKGQRKGRSKGRSKGKRG